MKEKKAARSGATEKESEIDTDFHSSASVIRMNAHAIAASSHWMVLYDRLFQMQWVLLSFPIKIFCAFRHFSIASVYLT